MDEFVVLVNEKDEEAGTKEKLAAHRDGDLHRAFSVFILNSRGEFLLQKRAATKYHSPGLWSNTCCGHPRPGENIQDAAKRRLKEESGLVAELIYAATFRYNADLGNGLRENEIDHVYFGICNNEPGLIPSEVSAWKCMTAEKLMVELSLSSQNFTVWFSEALKALMHSETFKSYLTRTLS